MSDKIFDGMDKGSRTILPEPIVSMQPDSAIGPLKVYMAFLTQLGTAIPTAVIVKNSLGGLPVFSRTIPGEYYMTLAGAFTLNKTWVTITTKPGNLVSSLVYDISAIWSSVNTILIRTVIVDPPNGTLQQADNILDSTQIRVEVY